MQKQNAPVHAAIDIGSNTIHLVVARSKPDDLDILADELELVRIGESVTATGKISQQKLRATINVLCRYKSLAEQHGADKILVVATEAIRQASNRRHSRSDVDLLWRNLRGTKATRYPRSPGGHGPWRRQH